MDEAVPLTVLDVYRRDGETVEGKIRGLPLNQGKKLFIETNCPDEPHENKVRIRFYSRHSILGSGGVEMVLDNGIQIEVAGEKRILFELPEEMAADFVSSDTGHGVHLRATIR
jgi:hypothetical protein